MLCSVFLRLLDTYLGKYMDWYYYHWQVTPHLLQSLWTIRQDGTDGVVNEYI